MDLFDVLGDLTEQHLNLDIMSFELGHSNVSSTKDANGSQPDLVPEAVLGLEPTTHNPQPNRVLEPAPQPELEHRVLPIIDNGIHMKVKELEDRLEYQRKLCEDLQKSILMDTDRNHLKSEKHEASKKRKYNTQTPLKEFIETYKEHEDILQALRQLPGLENSRNIPSCLVRSYLSALFKVKPDFF